MSAINVGRVLRVATFAFLCAAAAATRSPAVTIIVGGYNSVLEPRAGVVLTGRLIDPDAVVAWLPGGIPSASKYQAVEDELFQIALEAAENPGGGSVNLLGYSHGATMVLRIANHLGSLGLARRLKIVTIDRIAFAFPLYPRYRSVPDGVALAFNIYQTVDPSLTGGLVIGAVNEDATSEIEIEHTYGPLYNPDDDRFLHPYHHYIQDSDYVRRNVLAHFGVKYLPGIWKVGVTGTSIMPIKEFVLYHLIYVDGTKFDAKGWTALKEFSEYAGALRQFSLSGKFFIPTFAPDCPNLGVTDASGSFGGIVDKLYQTMNLQLHGQWPHYYPQDCTSAGLRRFSGDAHGTWIFAPLDLSTDPRELLEERREDQAIDRQPPSTSAPQPAADGAVPMAVVPQPYPPA